MSSWSHFLRLEQRVMVVAGRILDNFQPLVWLWPWLAGNLIFAGFLASSQGAALASGFRYDSISAFAIVCVVTASFVIVLFSCFLNMLVSGAARLQRPVANAAPGKSVFLAWVIGLASAPGLLFSVATGSWVAFATVLALFLISLQTLWKNRRRHYNYVLTVRSRLICALVLLAFACLPLLAGVAVVTHLPDLLDEIGPLLLSLFSLCALSSLLGNVLLAIPACTPRPWFVRALLMGWVVYSGMSRPFSPDEFNPLIEKERLAAQAQAQAYDLLSHGPCTRGLDVAINSLTARVIDEDSAKPIFFNQRPSKYPLYLISAEGGGIRAAYWTAVGLAQLDVATGNEFGNQVASLSGVSGGSLGIATWLAARELPGKSAEQRLQIITKFLSGDFLSPLLAGFFFLDGPRLLFGKAWAATTRDQVFEFAVARRWTRLSSSNFFVRPLSRMCLKSFKRKPMVAFNTTDALTGVPVRLGNVRVDPAFPMSIVGGGVPASHYVPDLLQDLSVAQAVHMSARFPFLSPGAEIADDVSHRMREEYANSDLKQFQEYLAMLKGTHIQVRSVVLVDGGYFDNSGLAVTRQFLETVQVARDGEVANSMNGPFRESDTVVLHFENNPGTTCLYPEGALQHANQNVKLLYHVLQYRYPCENDLLGAAAGMRSRPLQWLITPFEAMLSVRESHAAQELKLVEDFQRTRDGALYRFSVAHELSAMFGRKPLDILGDPMAWRTRGLERYVADYKSCLDDGLAQGKLSHDDYAGYVEQLNHWHRMAANYEEQLACARKLRLRQAPLGWILDRDNRELLSCAAARAAIEMTARQPPAYRNTVESKGTCALGQWAP